QLADEADGVGQDERPPARALDEPCGRIEGDEELVGGAEPRAREVVEQRRLAGVGVADEGDDGHARASPARALQATVRLHAFQLALELLHAPADHAAVGLELRLTGAPRADAAAEALQVLPLPDEPRHEVRERRSRGLELALRAARALGEDVENERGAVDHLDPQRLAEVARLDRRARSA